MLIACITDKSIGYNRRVIRGMVNFVRCHHDLEMEVVSPGSAVDHDAFYRKRYSGYIFTTWSDHAPAVLKHRLPAVSLSMDRPTVPIARVASDDYRIGCVAAEHLLAQGHRHLAFLGDDREPFSHDRHRGFETTIVKMLGARTPPTHIHIGVRNLAHRLARLPKPLGLMAANDNWGSYATAVCRRAGLRVPEDVAVIGVDDDDLTGGDMAIPPLSTVAQLTDRIGYTACELLMRLIHKKTIPPITLIPPGPLIVRQSTRAIAVDDELVVSAIGLMEHNLDRQITIEQLLDRLNVSRRALELHFKRALHRTPGHELLRLKIERAKHLLATTRLPIGKIAPMAGFTNSTHLSHAFRLITGRTPSDYRRQLALP